MMVIFNASSIRVTVKYGLQHLDDFQFIDVEHGLCVSGQDLFDQLGFCILDQADTQIWSVRASPVNARTPTSCPGVFQSTPAVSLNVAVLHLTDPLLQADPSKSIRGYLHTTVVNALIPSVV